MRTADVQALWPQWKDMGLLGEGRYGKVRLCHSEFEGQDVFSAVKIIDIPPNQTAIDAALKQGINKDMLKMYFGKFRDDLNWELSMYKPASGGALAPIDDCVFEEYEGEPGWRAYIRTGVYTPLSAYYGKNRADEAEATRMGIQLCRALEQLERFGLVHGEICPNNVMVMDSGDFVLTDFGIRRCLEKAGAGLFAVKRDGFDAPEVTSYNFINKSTDIYSVGMMLLCVLNGGVLPKSNNAKGALGDIIRKATAYNAAERYESAAQMREELEKLTVAAAPIRRMTAAVVALETVKRNAEQDTLLAQQAQERAAAVPPRQLMQDQARERARQEKKRRRVSRIIQTVGVLMILLSIGFVLYILRPWEKIGAGDDEDNSEISDTRLENEQGSADNTGDEEGDDSSNTQLDITGKGDGNTTDGTQTQPGVDADSSQSEDASTGETAGDDSANTDSETETDPETEGDADTEGGEDAPVPDAGDEGGMDLPVPESGNSGYILPSDTEYLTMDDLEGMDKWEATKALNEIYARHGMIFGNDDLADYFESQSWYEGTTTSASRCAAQFSDIEQANVDLIVKYMKREGYR